CLQHAFKPRCETLALPNLILLRPSVTVPVPESLSSLNRQWNSIPIVGLFCAEQAAPNDVVTSLNSGLDDFLYCPFREIDLTTRIGRFLSHRSSVTHSKARSDGESRQSGSLLGHSESFRRVLEKIPFLADSDGTVLLTGETGTGKDLFAREIHNRSARKGKPFVPLNCGAVPDQLFENELFGHSKGAFTNAISLQQGLITEAEGGTLFLDEVDGLSPAAQTKLLRFLQDHEYRPLGSGKSKIADVRIIAATNVPLSRLVEAKQFRDDLYYRLMILSLDIPPLRERLEDIPLLASYFVDRYAARHGRRTIRLAPEAVQKLLAYSWPGNVRELEGVILRGVVLSTAPILQPEDLALPLAPDGLGDSLRRVKNRTIQHFEQAYLNGLLMVYRGNISHAAKAAGKERRAFQRLVRKYGLERKDFQ
ncbi:MAG TPA: sigma-54 dependent transcriptional regulator, partial [Nitrospiraceae bacterium]|nr:sigma-54 dependent transcriptional regulator [Nitrospiraceae bacterium]